MDHQIVNRHLGLAFNPFTPATTEEGFFPTPQTQQILQELHFGIVSRKGFLLLLGEVGVGKTSLLLQLLRSLHAEADLRTAWIFNTSLNEHELLQSIISDFGLSPPENASLSGLLEVLHGHFLRVNQSGGNCAIVVDEAHNLSERALECLRMLSNLEGGGQKLVQILIAGQTELEQTLDSHRLRQLQSRIYLRRVLAPMTPKQTNRYCSYKLSWAGSHIPLSSSALRLLWRASRGNPRAVDLIMDRCLHALAIQESPRISRRIVRSALGEISPHHRLIRKNLRRERARRTAAVLTAAVIILWGAGTHFPSLTNSFPANAFSSLSALLEPGSHTDPETETKEKVNRSNPSRVNGTASSPAQPSPPQETSRKRLLRFLQSFNMVSEIAALQKSVQSGDIEHFEKRLPPDMRLAGLERLPPKQGNRFAALPWRELTGEGPKWYVLWKPALNLHPEQPRESSHSDIVILQTILREQGYYNYRIDGRYGPRTRRALRAYQEDLGLDPSHGPDTRTLFFLSLDFAHVASPSVDRE